MGRGAPAQGRHGREPCQQYYSGIGADSTLQPAFAGFEVAIGALVVPGLIRTITTPLAAVILVGGAMLIWRHFLDPFGIYRHADANLLFFPSVTAAGAALALIAMREQDRLALDRVIGKKHRGRQ
ncbi:MAG: hypothetical protein ACK4IC_04535 [Erythrobacter sp.]